MSFQHVIPCQVSTYHITGTKYLWNPTVLIDFPFLTPLWLVYTSTFPPIPFCANTFNEIWQCYANIP